MSGPCAEGPPTADERERVLTAFVELVVERGFGDVDRAGICARAGVPRRAFERHFPDQLACFAAAWERLEDAYMKRLLAAYEGGEGWREQLRAVATATVELIVAHPTEARFLAVEALAVGGSGRRHQQALAARVTELLDRVRTQLEDPAALSPATSSWVAGVFFDRIYRSLAAGREAELRDELPQLMFLAVSAYSGTGAGLTELRSPPP